MNTQITVSLDSRRAKKDNTYPIILRLGHNERTAPLPLGISVLKKDWDDEKKEVKKSYFGSSSVPRLNNLIQKKRSDALDDILKLEESGTLNSLSVIELKQKLLHGGKAQSFIKYGESLIVELRQAKRIGTANSYKDVLSVLKNYRKKDVFFNEINYTFLMKFEAHHLGKGSNINGFAVYMRAVRAIFNKAIKAGIINKEIYPFDNYKIRTTPTKKRALDFDLLKRIIDLELESQHPCFNARNFFLASYMMYGMTYTDMAFLSNNDIKNGRIYYRRKKTGKLYDIKITPRLGAIIQHYKGDKYVFPILKRNTAELQSKDIKWSRKRYNNKLDKIAQMCSIDTNLTSYVTRHSFATQAMFQQIPLNAISSMLGHSSLKTTEIYLKSLPSNVLDDYNSLVLGDLN